MEVALTRAVGLTAFEADKLTQAIEQLQFKEPEPEPEPEPDPDPEPLSITDQNEEVAADGSPKKKTRLKKKKKTTRTDEVVRFVSASLLHLFWNLSLSIEIRLACRSLRPTHWPLRPSHQGQTWTLRRERGVCSSSYS